MVHPTSLDLVYYKLISDKQAMYNNIRKRDRDFRGKYIE